MFISRVNRPDNNSYNLIFSIAFQTPILGFALSSVVSDFLLSFQNVFCGIE